MFPPVPETFNGLVLVSSIGVVLLFILSLDLEACCEVIRELIMASISVSSSLSLETASRSS